MTVQGEDHEEVLDDLDAEVVEDLDADDDAGEVRGGTTWHCVH